jgi:glucose 1-dehydrogenase
MRALTVIPGKKGSVELSDVAEPSVDDGAVVVQTTSVGVCGTDLEIANGEYGTAPAGQERLIIGHESLGHVLDAPAGFGLSTGDLVVGDAAVMVAVAISMASGWHARAGALLLVRLRL